MADDPEKAEQSKETAVIADKTISKKRLGLFGKILIIFCVVLIGAVFVRIGIAIKDKSQLTGAVSVSRHFLDELKSGNVDAAYAKISKDYTKTLSKDQVATYVASPTFSAALKGSAVVTEQKLTDNGSRAEVTVRFTSDNAVLPVRFKLQRQNGAWVIQQIEIISSFAFSS